MDQSNNSKWLHEHLLKRVDQLSAELAKVSEDLAAVSTATRDLSSRVERFEERVGKQLDTMVTRWEGVITSLERSKGYQEALKQTARKQGGVWGGVVAGLVQAIALLIKVIHSK